MRRAMEEHNRLLRASIERRRGSVLKTKPRRRSIAARKSRRALAEPNRLLRASSARPRGFGVEAVRACCCRAFGHGASALTAACEVQLAVSVHPWPPPCDLRVRVALHTGDGEPQEADYLGPPVNRVACLLAAGHGGQILLSQAARDGVTQALPA